MIKVYLPFEITPQIKRYIDELIFANDPDDEEFVGGKTLIDTYVIGERKSYVSLENIQKFLKFLSESHIVEIGESPKAVESYKNKEKSVSISPERLNIKVIDIEAMRSFEAMLEKAKAQTQKKDTFYYEEFRGLITCPNIKSHSFRKDRENKSVRQKVFEELYTRRRHLKSGRIELSGDPLECRFIAKNVGLAQDAHKHSYNESGEKEVLEIVRYLKRDLRQFPLKITKIKDKKSKVKKLLMTVEE